MRLVLLTIWLVAASVVSQATDDATENLITAVLSAERSQRELLHDVTFDAEYVEREDDDGTLVEKIRLVKQVYLEYSPDTIRFAEKILEFYKDGQLQDSEATAKEARERLEKKEKRRARDISWPMLRPFTPAWRDSYEIEYLGLADEVVTGYSCLHFRVTALEKSEELINGDYFFEAESFQLARVDFSPAKLVKKFMFKLNHLRLTLDYAPAESGVWLPARFEVTGKGKAAFLVGVKISGTEYYRNPRINSGVDPKIFEEYNDNQ